MTENISERVLKCAEYLVENKATIRQTAKQFGIAKSTVHTDLTERLCKLDSQLFIKAREILDVNFSLRQYRGGESTRKKFSKKNKT